MATNTFPQEGNVGIGTTEPGKKLSVAGTVESTGSGFKFPDGTVQATAARVEVVAVTDWIRQLGSAREDRALGVAVDAKSHDVYLTGYTTGLMGQDPFHHTIEFWIKPLTATNDMRIIGGDNHSTDFHVSIQNNKIVFWPPGWQPITSSTIPVGQWTHIALVTNGNRLTGFVNGKQELTTTTSAQTFRTKLGSKYLGYGANFRGEMDEFRFWNVARSQTEIAADMKRRLDGKEPGLLAYYAFNEGPGSTMVADGSGNGYTGTLHNMDPQTAWVSPGAITP